MSVEVVVCIDPTGGGEPIEAPITLPFVPRKGDMLRIWRQEVEAEVDTVVVPTYDDRIEVWVTFDTYDLEEVERAMAALAAATPRPWARS